MENSIWPAAADVFEFRPDALVLARSRIGAVCLLSSEQLIYVIEIDLVFN